MYSGDAETWRIQFDTHMLGVNEVLLSVRGKTFRAVAIPWPMLLNVQPFTINYLRVSCGML